MPPPPSPPPTSPPTNAHKIPSFLFHLSFPPFLIDWLLTLLLKLCPFVVTVKCDICLSFFQFFNILSMSCWLALPRTATCRTTPLASRCARLHRETAVFLVSLSSLSGCLWLSVCPSYRNSCIWYFISTSFALPVPSM